MPGVSPQPNKIKRARAPSLLNSVFLQGSRESKKEKASSHFPPASPCPVEEKALCKEWGKKESPGDVKGRKVDEAGCSHNHTVYVKSWVLRAPLYEFTARGQGGGISAICWMGAAASRLMTEQSKNKKSRDAKLEQILFLSLSPAAQVISTLPAMEGIPLVPIRDIRVNQGPQTRPKTWQ